jgi:Flp pilus assembly pilin Flp
VQRTPTSGTSVLEYAIIIALIVIAVIAALVLLGPLSSPIFTGNPGQPDTSTATPFQGTQASTP